MKDYYSILGVSRSANETEIKKAYRKKLRELHPDLADNNADNDEAVKEVNDAFEVLGHADKRDLYDRGVDPLSQSQSNGFSNFGFGASDMFSDLFNMFGGGFTAGSSRRGASRKTRGQDILVHESVDLKTAIFGGKTKLQFETLSKCSKCSGSGSTTQKGEVMCSGCDGLGTVQHMTRTMFGQMVSQSECPACHGFGTVIADPCNNCDSFGVIRENRVFEVELPAGSATRNRLKIENEGAQGTNGGNKGDLFVEISVKKDDIFEIQDYDLICKLSIPVTVALVGGEVKVQTLDGEKTIKIEAGTNSGTAITLKNLGMPKFIGSLDNRGNLKVFCDVKLPQKLSSNAKKLVAELSSELKDDKVVPVLESLQTGGFLNWFKNLMH